MDIASELSIDLFATQGAAYGLERIRWCVLAVSFWQLTMFLIIDSTYKQIGFRSEILKDYRLKESIVQNSAGAESNRLKWIISEMPELLKPFNFLFYFFNYFIVFYFFSFPDLGRENIENLAAIFLCESFMAFGLQALFFEDLR